MHSLDAHINCKNFKQPILVIESKVSLVIDVVCDRFIFLLSCSSNFCYAHCLTSAIEAIDKLSFQLILIINGLSFMISVPIKSITAKRANKLLHRLISKSPDTIACFKEMSHVLFRATLSIELLELRRLIPCWHAHNLNMLGVGLGIHQRWLG